MIPIKALDKCYVTPQTRHRSYDRIWWSYTNALKIDFSKYSKNPQMLLDLLQNVLTESYFENRNHFVSLSDFAISCLETLLLTNVETNFHPVREKKQDKKKNQTKPKYIKSPLKKIQSPFTKKPQTKPKHHQTRIPPNPIPESPHKPKSKT